MVKYYNGQMPLFQFANVDRQIKGAFGRSVSMPKGAYLIIGAHGSHARGRCELRESHEYGGESRGECFTGELARC